MTLYTKRGDDGTTDLVGGARVRKSDPRVAVCGGIDETNAAIGVVIATCHDDGTVDILRRIQAELFALGAELATPGDNPQIGTMTQARVAELERWIDEAADEVKPLKQFVLPGGTETAAGLHMARTICRRAERAMVALASHEPVGRWAMAYVNRLSDLLFALARRANHRAHVADIPWVATESET